MTKNIARKTSVGRLFGVIALAIALLYGVGATTAHADSDKGFLGLKLGAKTDVGGIAVRVDGNTNTTVVHRATVTATSTSGFTAKVSTSTPVFTLNVQTDASTKFEARGKGKVTLANITVGDMVNFRGTVLSGLGTSNLTIKATHVEDKSPKVKRQDRPVTNSGTTTSAQVRIEVLTRLIAQLQTMLANIKLSLNIQ